VSTMVRERGGFSLLSELGYVPVNQYLPPRDVPAVAISTSPTAPSGEDASASALSRLIARARAVLAR